MSSFHVHTRPGGGLGRLDVPVLEHVAGLVRIAVHVEEGEEYSQHCENGEHEGHCERLCGQRACSERVTDRARAREATRCEQRRATWLLVRSGVWWTGLLLSRPSCPC